MPIAILYYKVPPESIASEQLSSQIADWVEELPILKQKSLKKLRQPKDQLLSVIGLKLLKIAMDDFLEISPPLKDLQFPEKGKPFFNADFDFNISHSGDIVCCIVSKSMTVGIDIELHREVSDSILDKYLPQKNISVNKNNKDDFFNLWTKNEAIIKAANQGSIHNMAEIKLEHDGGYYNNDFWSTYPVKIISVDDNKEYTCHIACSEKLNSAELSMLNAQRIINLS